LVQKNLREWDLKLPHAEFAYNMTPGRATRCSPFQALYGINLLTLVDLISLLTYCKVSFEAVKRAKEIKKLHEQIRAHTEKVNEAYKVKSNKNRNEVEHQPGGLFWLHLRKKIFPTRRKIKLIVTGDGLFSILAKVGANAYKIKLPGDMAVSATFNVRDLSPYVEDEINYGDLRASHFKGGENDAGQGLVQATQSEERKSLLTDHPKDQFCEGK